MKFSFLSYTLALLFFSIQILHSQIVDDFSDGNFDQNPGWVGDIPNFIVNPAGELQLNSTGSGQAVLLVAGNMPDSTVWDFEVRLAFAPSGQNLVRIFLQIDQTDLTVANGYFIEMGETGSLDAIRFFRQDGSSKTLLATGQPGLAANFPDLHIRAKRSITGNWTLEAATVGAALQLQFVLTDNSWPGGIDRFFGVQCVYTTTNATKFFFDNINIRPDVPDTQPPVLLSAQGDSIKQVTAVFDEDIEVLSAENPANYSINNGIGQPLAAMLLPDVRTVVLTLQNSLSTGAYTLQTSGIKDVLGNVSSAQTADFQFIKVEVSDEFDILINEIMADPTPSRGLPELEWVEIFNRSNKVFDLSNFRFSDGSSGAIPLPVFALQPGAYAVLTANANVVTLQAAATNGNVLGIGISSIALNNDGDVLTLSDASGKIIDRVTYGGGCNASSADYEGVSRERINPTLPCLGLENWQACPAQIGATLGFQNASYDITADLIAPKLSFAYPESPSSILLTFSKGLDRQTAQNKSVYQLFPSRSIASATQLSDDRARVRLSLNDPLEPATIYRIKLGNGLEDCSGNLADNTDTTYVGLPEKPEFQDIVLNEILFNPNSGGARYLEFYNRSQKIFDWSEFFLADISSAIAITPKRLLLPGLYHVLSNNPEDIRSRHQNIYPGRILCQSLPSLDDNNDLITLYWAGGGQSVTVDSLYYRRGMHNPLLSTSEQEGVALERIRVDEPTQSNANWTSAASLLTGAAGTPTLPNSQARSATSPSADLITIPVARLSPDGDAYEDFLEIFYTLPKEGYAASLTIFDSDGNRVKSLIKQDLVGTEGAVRWDGDTDSGESVKARPGIHILYFEIFGPDGDVKREKKAVAVLGRF
ncbi:MAG: lamin tail domain-containing protein [Saprospiraceae bacterium]|nr:lamin tail domain-containing protein [Saprospiraceae bacterium]